MTEKKQTYMEDNGAPEIVEAEFVQLGMVRATGPADVIRQATDVATELTAIIDSRRLYAVIRGKKHVMVEGWTTLGAMLGVVPREVSAERQEDGGYVAVVELVRADDIAIIGRGSALCGMDEIRWASADEYARRSMAITRATGKAFRLGFSWIMELAGYSPTPAEEMPNGESKKAGPKKANGNGCRWSSQVIQAITKEKLAANSYNAVGMLNLSTLDPGDAEDVILNWARVYREARATAESKEAAAIANAWLSGEMSPEEEASDG